MKITKRQLRRMISEAMPRGSVPDIVGALTNVPGGNIQNLVDEYKKWAMEYMGTSSGPNSSSVLATFLVDQGLDQGPTAEDIITDMSSAMEFDKHDVNREVSHARREYDAGRTLPEGKVKITKRQLHRIIKEEKAKLLRESVADIRHFEEAADKCAERMSDLFYNDMMKLYDEEPDAFARPVPGSEAMTRTEKGVWEQQVVYATQELENAISFSIAQAIEEIEMKLHDGQYHDDR